MKHASFYLHIKELAATASTGTEGGWGGGGSGGGGEWLA